ncbi:hypothetical protein B5M42_017485 [Paenibacillus athensensis]|uniref:Uncharacterized protein n=1 Tax=Paenibacillus athensensis TaxID=1967502 RepID=A0A4Y8PYT2_9BACL|nr:hypothetical protein [Paenibacillus athensensis]MCD1260598.1 hypothetical protein [Paenibacillus athensensis]
MPFTTGLITNTRDFGTAATNIVMNTRNLDQFNSATILVQVFGSVNSVTFNPLYQTAYVVGANSNDVREFYISGNVAYEVQIGVTSLQPANVVLSVFGIDAFGNLVANQRVLQSELTTITALSPIP